ncbi:head-tail connector protein [Megasphaera vaginalis (ex Srinivasan et al. 2021)]|uniref:Phage gp6-like head-tail connector protein n=1 Tax=Megasphaera vaginalis (ex Srinivasan et al. 2021) TaxID=1111454 RepID=U7UTZ9_9FIRM|nr:head-tail connector protein [Megasphaera vaginalis (ex Srinivasan et al. 2021)]ERT62374.1 Phage gp6-like head-tail connector protein [Megasphaera vaginalis (ex Srinivasan et al. 2021)]
MDLLDDVKLYLRVDGVEEDSVIKNLIDTAKLFITQGTGVSFAADNPQHVLTLKLLAAHWYDNRGAVGQSGELPYSITAQLIQIEAAGRSTI